MFSFLMSILTQDNYTFVISFDTIPDYTAACVPNCRIGARIGISCTAINTIQENPLEILAFNSSISMLEGLEAATLDNTDFLEELAFDTNNDILTVLEMTFNLTQPNSFRSYQLTYTLSSTLQITRKRSRERIGRIEIPFWEDALALNLTQTCHNYREALFTVQSWGVTVLLNELLVNMNRTRRLCLLYRLRTRPLLLGFQLLLCQWGLIMFNHFSQWILSFQIGRLPHPLGTLAVSGPQFPLIYHFQVNSLDLKYDPHLKPSVQLIDVINPPSVFGAVQINKPPVVNPNSNGMRCWRIPVFFRDVRFHSREYACHFESNAATFQVLIISSLSPIKRHDI